MDDLLMKGPEFIDRLFGKVVAGFHLIPDLFLLSPELQLKSSKNHFGSAVSLFWTDFDFL